VAVHPDRTGTQEGVLDALRRAGFPDAEPAIAPTIQFEFVAVETEAARREQALTVIRSISPGAMDETLMRGANQTGYAVMALCRMARLVGDPEVPSIQQMACIQAYVSNMRALVEFLLRRHDPRHIHRYCYLPGWDPTPSDATRELDSYVWDTATETVAHLSWDRIPRASKAVVDDSATNLLRLAGLMLDVLSEFADELEAQDHPNARQFHDVLQLGRSALTEEG
jgi:hypothetical protein